MGGEGGGKVSGASGEGGGEVSGASGGGEGYGTVPPGTPGHSIPPTRSYISSPLRQQLRTEAQPAAPYDGPLRLWGLHLLLLLRG